MFLALTHMVQLISRLQVTIRAVTLHKATFGYIWQNGINYVEQNLVSYLDIHNLNAQFVAQPTQATAQTLVQNQINAGNPLIAPPTLPALDIT